MQKEAFGSVQQYESAFAALLRERMPANRWEILRHHFESHRHTATAQQLAERVGYSNYGGVNSHGSFARDVAAKLRINEKPRGFWLFVLVDWADESPGP